MGLLFVVPASVLLTISFFVLFAIRKLDRKELKIFGYVVTALLWISAGILVGTGFALIVNGCPLIPGPGARCFMQCPFTQDPGPTGREMGMMRSMMMRKSGMPMKTDLQCIPGKDSESAGMPPTGRGPMSAPHGMMKYHQYDKDGNIILEDDDKEPVKKTKTGLN